MTVPQYEPNRDFKSFFNARFRKTSEAESALDAAEYRVKQVTENIKEIQADYERDMAKQNELLATAYVNHNAAQRELKRVENFWFGPEGIRWLSQKSKISVQVMETMAEKYRDLLDEDAVRALVIFLSHPTLTDFTEVEAEFDAHVAEVNAQQQI